MILAVSFIRNLLTVTNRSTVIINNATCFDLFFQHPIGFRGINHALKDTIAQLNIHENGHKISKDREQMKAPEIIKLI